MERESQESLLEKGWNKASESRDYAVYEKKDDRLLYRKSTGQIISQSNTKNDFLSKFHDVYSKLKIVVSSEWKL